MSICNFFDKFKTKCFGLKDNESNVHIESKSNKTLLNDSLEFEIIDFNNYENLESNFNRRCYSIDSEQRRQNRKIKKLNPNLSLSFSSSHSECSNNSRDNIFAELVKEGAPSFVNSWSHLNKKGSTKLSDFINRKKLNLSNSSINIDGYQYSNSSINDFQKISELGSGNFGCVQKFLHLKSGYHLAVKRMKYYFNYDTDNNNEDDNRKHIQNELELLTKSKHENIVKFYGYIIWNYDSELWLCMELMDCCFDRIIYHNGSNSSTIIPETIIGSVTISIINALMYLKCTHQMIHRDIKPSNILINQKGQIKLCDFGISGCLIDSMTSSKTMGSIAYQAPERIQSPIDSNSMIDFKYDCRVDVWSLGLTLLEMALGYHPYGKWTVTFEIITKIMNPNYMPKLSTLLTNKYSKNFKNFINSCLQHDYRLRPKYDQIKLLKFYKEQIQKFDIKIVCDWFNNLVYINNNNNKFL